MATTETSGGGLGIVSVTTLIFVILKLTGSIDWSWWWVLSPLWIAASVFVVLAIVVAIIVGIVDR